MKRIVLLRFHKNKELVQNRINIIKYFNPDIHIYGLYGGPIEEVETFKSYLKGLENLFVLNSLNAKQAWRFSDYGILKWYESVGRNIEFDLVYTIEYDLVILDKLTNVYKYNEGEKHVYITNLLELDKVIPESNWFQNPEFPVKECYEFVDLMKSKYKLNNLYNSKAPGATLTREYLEGYSKLNIPLIGFDEIRLPAIAQILGIEIKDTGFVNDWFDEESIDFQLFNTDNVLVSKALLLKAYFSGYKAAFHPCYEFIETSELGAKASMI